MPEALRSRILVRTAAVLLGLALVAAVLLTQGFLQKSPSSPPPSKSDGDADTDPGSQPLIFLAFGDSGTAGAEQKALAARLGQEEAEFALHTGDVVYPCGTAAGYQTNFADIYSSFLSRAPIYPSPGNHDYQCDGLAAYLDFFSRERFYSFDENGIHFVGLDSNRINEEQLDWLEADLSRSTAEIKVAFFHHPPFSSGTVHGGNETAAERLAPLLERYGVDLVFLGHEHNYERLIRDGVVYIVTGGGGGPLYQFGDPAAGSQARLSDYHYVRVSVDGCGASTVAVRRDGTEFDPAVFQVCESE